MFKKSITILSFLIILFLPFFVFSDDSTFGLDRTASTTGYEITGDQGDINLMAGKVIRIGFGTVAFVFFGLTVYAGLRWLTARGNEEYIERAKKTMEAAIIGLIVVALSYALANFVVSRLSQPGTGGQSEQKSCCMCNIKKVDTGGNTIGYEYKGITLSGNFNENYGPMHADCENQCAGIGGFDVEMSNGPCD